MYYKNKTQKINELKTQLNNAKPSRVSIEDIEDVSDNYQANLEWGYYRDEVESEMQSIREMSYAEFNRHYNSPEEDSVEEIQQRHQFGDIVDGVPWEDEY